MRILIIAAHPAHIAIAQALIAKQEGMHPNIEFGEYVITEDIDHEEVSLEEFKNEMNYVGNRIRDIPILLECQKSEWDVPLRIPKQKHV